MIKFFGQERYHEALECFVYATVKLAPWDTAVLPLETSITSGFIDAEFAIMSNIMEAATRVRAQISYPGPHWVGVESSLLHHMIRAANEYMSLSPAYRPGANKEYDDLLRGPLAGRIGSVIPARSRASGSLRASMRGTLFFHRDLKEEGPALIYLPRTPGRVRAAQEFCEVLPGMVPLGTVLGWIRFLGEGGGQSEAAAEEQVV